MKTEIASFPKMRRFGVTPLAVVAALSLTLLSCKTSTSAGPDGGGSGTGCNPSVGASAGTAIMLTSGQTLESKICFEGGSNWFAISVPSGNTLLDVAAGYAIANPTVDLEVKLFYQTDSSTLTEVLADLDGGPADDLVAPSQSDAGVDAIHTTLHVVTAGTYYLQIADSQKMAFDATNAYTLSVAYAADPDTHEPNDTPATAKQSDGKRGYLAYYTDIDNYTTTAASADDLLSITINNPMTAPQPVNYNVLYFPSGSSTAMSLGQGAAPPSAKPYATFLQVPATGQYYLQLTYPPNTVPDRTAGYVATFSTVPNPSKTNNHSVATALCPGGGSGPCTMAFTGQPVMLPSQMGYISTPGQDDYYRVDVTSGAAAILEINLTASASTPVQYAVDLLVPEPGSPCQTNDDCAAVNLPCKSANDCELSHSCLAAGNYNFCTSGMCQLCEGAGLCIPQGSSGGKCAIAQYLSAFYGEVVSAGMVTAGSSLSTAQPLFSNSPYYIRVHDATGMNVDIANAYTLSLQIAPEPDPNDQSTNPTQRNNFYNPYPTAMTDDTPNVPLAVDITPQVLTLVDGGAPTTFTGYISYQTDEDWYAFQNPCPGANCGIQFQWTQPQSSVQVAFFNLQEDLDVNESFTYTGTTPTASLPGPQTLYFPNPPGANNPDCHQCSGAFTLDKPSGSGPYTFFLRITDLHEKNWDFTSGGKYSFQISSVTPGCPAACSYAAPVGLSCACYCPAGDGGPGCPTPAM